MVLKRTPMIEQVENDSVRARINMKYHSYRYGSYKKIDDRIKIITTIASLSSFASLGFWKTEYGICLLGVLTFVISILQGYVMAANPGASAIFHTRLAQQWSDLSFLWEGFFRRLDRKPRSENPTEAELDEYERLMSIESQIASQEHLEGPPEPGLMEECLEEVEREDGRVDPEEEPDEPDKPDETDQNS